MNKEQYKGAINILEALIEIAEEEGLDAVPLEDIEELYEKYKKQARLYE